MNHLRLCIHLLLYLLLLPGLSLAGEHMVAKKESLIAAYVYNFIQYSDWPTSKNDNAGKLLSILGTHPFGTSLDAIAEKSPASHRLSVRYCADIPCLQGSDAVFIPRAEASSLPQTLQALQGEPILTISDIPDFATSGGMIELVYKNKKLRFRINLLHVKREKILISSQLLHFSEVIEEEVR